MGSFTLGFNGEDKKGPHTRWNMNPYVFDNAYYQEILLKDQSKYAHTEADRKLVQNSELRSWVEAFAEDEELFFKSYARAHVKMSEIGWEGQLLSEIEPHRIVDGGYMEESRMSKMIAHYRTAFSAYMSGQDQQELIEAEEEARRQLEEPK